MGGGVSDMFGECIPEGGGGHRERENNNNKIKCNKNLPKYSMGEKQE